MTGRHQSTAHESLELRIGRMSLVEHETSLGTPKQMRLEVLEN